MYSLQHNNVAITAVLTNDRHQLHGGPIGQLLIVIECSQIVIE
jgi:hypothetical protein